MNIELFENHNYTFCQYYGSVAKFRSLAHSALGLGDDLFVFNSVN